MHLAATIQLSNGQEEKYIEELQRLLEFHIDTGNTTGQTKEAMLYAIEKDISALILFNLATGALNEEGGWLTVNRK